MKKIIMFVCGILMISNMVHAECKGITIKGDFCLSKVPINWYSAYVWCRKQGMELIDLGKDCERLAGHCENLRLTDAEANEVKQQGGTLGWSWTNNSINAKYVTIVNLPEATLVAGANANSRSHENFALCR